MASALHEFLARDHVRLDALLAASLSGNLEAYDTFRRGLLRHIAIEEKVLFPLLRAHRGLTAIEDQLHRDHAALTVLLVPPPDRSELVRIASILGPHNVLEEKLGGLYEIVEELAGEELAAVMARVGAIPEVRVVPNTDTPLVRETIELLVREAEEGRRRFQ